MNKSSKNKSEISPDCSANPFLEAERSRSHRKRLQRKAGLQVKRSENVLLLIVRIRVRFFDFFYGS